jgi:hypothetical protein
MVQRRVTRRRHQGGVDMVTKTATTPDPYAVVVDASNHAMSPHSEQDSLVYSPVDASGSPALSSISPTPSPMTDVSGTDVSVTDVSGTAAYIYKSTQISTQPNTDADYQEIGVIHVTDSSPINAARGLATGVANFFGSKGYDNTVFDFARNDALEKMSEQLTSSQKVCNLRMEVSNDTNLVFVHLYGTLLDKAAAADA